jgi:hypothetical protein
VFSKIQGKFSGIAKFDLAAKDGATVAGQIEHGPDRYGGEAVFVSGSGPGECRSGLLLGSYSFLMGFAEDALAGHRIVVCSTRSGARLHDAKTALILGAPVLRLTQLLSHATR